MGIGFLSQQLATKQEVDVPVKFGSLDYSAPEVIEALTAGGLKERATLEGGQIVTALKMAWWVLTLPARVPCWIAGKVLSLAWVVASLVFARIQSIIHSIGGMGREVKDWLVDMATIVSAAVNWRLRVLWLVGLCFALTFGLVGLSVWMAGAFGFILCYVPSDARYYIRFLERMQRAWDCALEEDELVALPKDQQIQVPKLKRDRFACKLAVRAISRVGMLNPTKANALVYQKVILDDMRELNVRCNDRIRVLPLAIAACLDRPSSVRRAEECVRTLVGSQSGNL
jgi:hypothetical protein